MAAIFSSRLLNGQPPVIFEDGHQSRDFVHVSDIVRANLLAMEREEMDYQSFNVASGLPVTILQVAEQLGQHLNSRQSPEIALKYRAGDIRHCFADVSRIRAQGYQPRVRFEDGINELVTWVRRQAAEDPS